MRLVDASLLSVLLLLLTACGTDPSGRSMPSPVSSSADGSSPSASATVSSATTGTTSASGIVPASPVLDNNELTVFAAASLTEAFIELGKRFDAVHNSTTTFNFAGSQQLAQQLALGAPADVFASANAAQMDKIIRSGQVVSGTQQTFVRNRLVVIYPQDNPAQLTELKDLANPGVKLVLAAKEVPVGQYSLDVLRKASELPEFTATFSETVLANVVSYEENVRAVLSKVMLGEADAGIVYSSNISGEAAGKVIRIDIPDGLNTIAAYPIAPIKDAPNVALAQMFVDYVLSAEAQEVLSNYGFIPVTDTAGATLPPEPELRRLPSNDTVLPTVNGL